MTPGIRATEISVPPAKVGLPIAPMVVPKLPATAPPVPETEPDLLSLNESPPNAEAPNEFRPSALLRWSRERRTTGPRRHPRDGPVSAERRKL